MNILTKEKAIELNGKKIKLVANVQVDWFKVQLNGIYRIFLDERDGVVWFFKPRAIRAGHTFGNLQNPTYELL